MEINNQVDFNKVVIFSDLEEGDVFICTHRYYEHTSIYMKTSKTNQSVANSVNLKNGQLKNFDDSTVVAKVKYNFEIFGTKD